MDKAYTAVPLVILFEEGYLADILLLVDKQGDTDRGLLEVGLPTVSKGAGAVEVRTGGGFISELSSLHEALRSVMHGEVVV